MADTFPALLEARLRDALAKVVGDTPLPPDFAASVGPAQNAQFGDYQANAAMVLAKALKANPRQIAAGIVEHFDAAGLCESPTIDGPGFVNFRLAADTLAARVRAMLADPEKLGVAPAAEPKTVVVDFSAPNVAKPMHVGHIRSTILGDCLARIARFLGHRVITDNHIGDWGT
ncbi:MAG: arginine--tRNA ligase, partial [Verrucomicrobiae bacterium]|nr:arginine--tRNA ligase [Verrucomicrobiae bacterium]